MLWLAGARMAWAATAAAGNELRCRPIAPRIRIRRYMKISVGPLLYLWERAATLEFYARLCDAPVDIVYLGEVICGKRRLIGPEDWLQIAAALSAAGKQVVFSTAAVIHTAEELAALLDLIDGCSGLVEANDYAAVSALGGRDFIIGPHLNVYNEATLSLLGELGARRWVAPVELALATLATLSERRPVGMQFELFCYGRLPLALSTLCFTARRYRRTSQDCELVCRRHPDGITLHSREGQPFLALNGQQTQSAAVHNLHPQLNAIRLAGVDIVRLSPQSGDFLTVVRAFREAMQAARTASELPPSALPGGYCDGYSSGAPGMLRETP